MKHSVMLFAALAAVLLPFRADAAEESVNVHVRIAQVEKVVLDEDINVTDQDGDGKLTSGDAILLAHDLYFPGGAARGFADESFIWGLQGEYFYTNISAGETSDPELHNPVGQRRDLREGDSLTWEAGSMHNEMFYICSPSLDELNENGGQIPQGAEIKVAVNHVIPTQPTDEPTPGVEITLNGEPTGIYTDEHGWAALKLNKAGTYSVGAVTDAYGIPFIWERTFTVEPAKLQIQLAADAGEAPKTADVIQAAPQAADKQTAEPAKQPAETKPAEKQTAVTKLPANAQAVQQQAGTPAAKPAAATDYTKNSDTLPVIFMTMACASVAALFGMLFILFRKLR
ncbi:MAG: hypothetical protein IK107_02340 [Oscillospiraceae bacterium]|nr:hypothetical protein [Oscillospiraceae bacterium]